ncbi:MAG TPA: PEGA domain-containing protein [Kofleriaceae bacterium]|nr:PEGA domain-containing protein [Kofleriaceae bacterium]
MDDTDQMQRVTTPFLRPSLDELGQVGQLDLTPTTAPGNTPGTPRRRLARGTLAPPASAVEILKLEATALPVRLIDPPSRWSYRERVDLQVPLAESFYALKPVAGEIDTAPVHRISATPWGLMIGLSLSTAAVLAAIWVVLGAGSADQVPARAVAPATPATVVVALPEEPAAEPAPAPAPQTIVLPADPADDLAAIDAAAATANAADVADEIEMPADEVAIAAAAPAAPATAAHAAPTHATLMIGSKPPCRILIDGRDTGLTTPNRAVRVPAGRHTITLVNDDLGIRHAETLNITGGRKAKMIRDLTSKL